MTAFAKALCVKNLGQNNDSKSSLSDCDKRTMYTVVCNHSVTASGHIFRKPSFSVDTSAAVKRDCLNFSFCFAGCGNSVGKP